MRIINWIKQWFKKEDTELERQIRAIPYERRMAIINEIRLRQGM